MNGAESVVHTLRACGVEVCFANPGTSEIHFVAALDAVPEMRGILVLFEGVASGAADGYARMSGKPAATLFHLGPGLGNAIANLHNARRAASPIVNIVGDHARDHLRFDAPLTSDIASLARPVSHWLGLCESARTAAALTARAVYESQHAEGGVATLILPADAAWGESEGAHAPLAPYVPPAPDAETLERVRDALKAARKPALLMRGRVLREDALNAAGRIAAATGARLLCDTFPPRLQRGAGRVGIERIPYFAEQVEEHLKDVDCLVLVGARPPVAFFAAPGQKGALAPETCAIHTLAHPDEDGGGALQMLADALKAPKAPAHIAALELPDASPSGALTLDAVARVVAAQMPDNAVLCDEAATSGLPAFISTHTARPHDYLALTGGAIGQGLPLATGAAVACPDRKIICLHGDGGAMYTLQSLWTQAREKLNVLTVIFSNRSYAILNIELARAGLHNAGPKALALLDLSNPDLNWVQLANGMGVAAERAETAEDFARLFADGVAESGPRLIEVVI